MRSGIKKHMLFNPITAERNLYTYEELTAITGRTAGHLKNYKKKTRKLKCLNAYILDEDADAIIRSELMQKIKLPMEVWRKCGVNYECSNYGRIRDIATNKINMPYLKANRTVVVRMGETHLLSRIIYTAFFGELPQGYFIKHKDGNKWNCNIDNLEIVSHENKNKVYRSNQKKCRSIIALNHITNDIKPFVSVGFAEEHGYNRRGINRAIKDRVLYKGLLWFNEDDYDDTLNYEPNIKAHGRYRPIYAEHIETGKRFVYETILKACEDFYCSRETMRRYALGNKVIDDYRIGFIEFNEGVQHER